MKFKLQLSSLLLNILEILCLCTPFCYNGEFWEIINGFGSATLSHTYGIFIFEFDSPVCIIFAVAILGLLGISAIFSFISIIKNKTLSKQVFTTTIVSFIMIIILTIIAINLKVDVNLGYREYSIGWMFYIIVAIHIANIIVSSIIKTDKIAEATKIEKITKVENTSNLDELKKLKELLDMGVINQEEFDAKKKQLLGL